MAAAAGMAGDLAIQHSMLFRNIIADRNLRYDILLIAVGLFKTRRILRRATHFVTFVSDFRNRSAHRSRSGFTERPRFAKAIIASQTLRNAGQKENRPLPSGRSRTLWQASDKPDTRQPLRLSHASPRSYFSQRLIQLRRQRHQHLQPRVR